MTARQTVHTHRASVHRAAKLVAALSRIARVTAGLAESNGSLPLGLWLTSPAGWLPRTGISSRILCSAIEYGLPLPFLSLLLLLPPRKNELFCVWWDVKPYLNPNSTWQTFLCSLLPLDSSRCSGLFICLCIRTLCIYMGWVTVFGQVYHLGL